MPSGFARSTGKQAHKHHGVYPDGETPAVAMIRKEKDNCKENRDEGEEEIDGRVRGELMKQMALGENFPIIKWPTISGRMICATTARYQDSSSSKG